MGMIAERADDIARDYLAGASIATLIRDYGVTEKPVRDFIASRGLKRPRISRKTVATDEARDRIVRAYLAGDMMESICQSSGLSYYLVRNVLKEAGHASRFDYTEQDVLSDYASGLTIRQISKKHKTSPNTVGEILNRHGVKMKDAGYEIDETVFDVMDEHLAYFLGLFCADGWIYKGRYFGITLHEEDEGLLKDLCKWMKTERPLTQPTGSGGFRPQGEKSRCRELRIGNQLICSKIAAFGLGEKKFNRVHIPEAIPAELLRHFVRGVFDGDGCVGHRDGQLRFRIAGYEPFMVELLNLISKQIGVAPRLRFVQYNSDGSRFSEISLSGNRKAASLFRWLYDGCSIKMERKYHTYASHQDLYRQWVKQKQDGMPTQLRDMFKPTI